MAADIHHIALFDAAQRALAVDQLDWLRDGRLADDVRAPLQRLLSEEGAEKLEQAQRDGRYSAEDNKLLPRQLALLTARRALLAARAPLSELLHTAAPLGSSAERPEQLLDRVLNHTGAQGDLGLPANALAAALAPLAPRWLELRERAQYVFDESLARATPVAALPSAPDSEQPPPEAAVDTASLPERAARWLAATDDAAGDMVQWLVRGEPRGRNTPWAQLLAALRAREFDGLARPTRRFSRLAEGARRLGFERDMTSRMRAEPAAYLLAPSARVVAFAVPSDIRVVEPSLDSGLLSDLAAAQGIGEGLALSLVSPALSSVTRWPMGVSVSGAIGVLFGQLRADAGYLRRIDGLERDLAERVARQVGVAVLLQSRWQAALQLAAGTPVRSEAERLAQLVEASERVFGCELPQGVVALAWLARPFDARDFEAADAGLALHAGLRERFDTDWFLNPRVSDVLRGGCARGNQLDVAAFAAELRVAPAAGSKRAIELLG
jgi:hypothetical protein